MTAESARASRQQEKWSLEGIQKQKEDEDKKADELTEVAEFSAQLREEQARSERWLNEQHTYAGLNLSGTEWQAMSRWFQDDDNVAAWEDQIMADTGMSRKDAKRVGGKMKRMYDLIDLQTQGKVLTPEQEKELNDLSNDSDVKKGVSAQQKIQSFQRNQVGVAAISAENETHLDSKISLNAASIATSLNDLNNDIDVKKGVYAQQEISNLHQNHAIFNDSETTIELTRTKNSISVTSILADGGSVGEVNNVKSITPTFNHVAPDVKITPPPVEIKVAEAPKLANTTVLLSADNMFG